LVKKNSKKLAFDSERDYIDIVKGGYHRGKPAPNRIKTADNPNTVTPGMGEKCLAVTLFPLLLRLAHPSLQPAACGTFDVVIS
jgi:hypothetical protein